MSDVHNYEIVNGYDNIVNLETLPDTKVVINGLDNTINQIGIYNTNLKVKKSDGSPTQAVTYGEVTTVDFDDIIWDRNKEFNISTHQFTAKESGYYLIGIGLVLSSVGEEWQGSYLPVVGIKVNGVEKPNSETFEVNIISNPQRNTVLYEHLNAGDTLEVGVRAGTQTGFSVLGNLNTWFFVKRVA